MTGFLKATFTFSVKSCESTMNCRTLKFGLISKFKLLLTFSIILESYPKPARAYLLLTENFNTSSIFINTCIFA